MSIAPILGRVPSGLFILTVRFEEQETGMLTSWVMQAGFKPPMITVCIRQGRYVADWLTARPPFVVNVLSEQNKDLLAHFGRGFEPGQPAFEGLQLDRTASGLAILPGTLGHLECQPVGHFDSADHRIFLAEVTGGTLLADQQPWTHIRKSGFHY
jgi:flavin reductase (DIM6/NTAB) family NADH-FMN oxidoreductase RutF